MGSIEERIIHGAYCWFLKSHRVMRIRNGQLYSGEVVKRTWWFGPWKWGDVDWVKISAWSWTIPQGEWDAMRDWYMRYVVDRS
jgi:hypothetical protein